MNFSSPREDISTHTKPFNRLCPSRHRSFSTSKPSLATTPEAARFCALGTGLPTPDCACAVPTAGAIPAEDRSRSSKIRTERSVTVALSCEPPQKTGPLTGAGRSGSRPTTAERLAVHRRLRGREVSRDVRRGRDRHTSSPCAPERGAGGFPVRVLSVPSAHAQILRIAHQPFNGEIKAEFWNHLRRIINRSIPRPRITRRHRH